MAHQHQKEDVNNDDDNNFLFSDESILLGEEDDSMTEMAGIIQNDETVDDIIIDMIEEDINDLLPSSLFVPSASTRPPRRRHYTDDAERYQVAKLRRKGQQQHTKDSIFCDEEEEEEIKESGPAAILSFFSNNGRTANTPIPDDDGENNNNDNNSASSSDEETEGLNQHWLSFSDAKEKLNGSKKETTTAVAATRQRTISSPTITSSFLQTSSIIEDGIWNTTTTDNASVVTKKTKFMVDTMVDPDDDSFIGSTDEDEDAEEGFNQEWLSMVDVGGEEEKVDDDDEHDDVDEVHVYDELDETQTQRRQRTWSTSSTTIATAAAPKRCLKEFYCELKQLIGYIIQHNRAKSIQKRIFGIMMLIITILVFTDLIFGEYIDTWLSRFIMWMADNGLQATFAFVVTFTFATLICVPPTILIFGAGYAFGQAHESRTVGVLVAIFACFLGSFIGAVLAFVRARYLMRDMVQMFARRYPLVKAADQALKRNGFRIMILLRLCPLIPFNGLNYCCGITGVSTVAFVNSLVGILPFQIYTVVIGAMAATLVSKHSGWMAWTLLACTGLLFGLVALVFLWWVVKKELQKELHLTSAELEVFFVSDHSSSSSPADVDDDHSTSIQMQEDIETGMNNDLVDLSSSKSSSSSSLSVGQLQHQDADEEWFWVWA